jgi:hypothetical protein
MKKLIKYKRLKRNMGVILIKNAIVRKAGFLYYVDGQGNVCEAKMSRGGRKRKK